MICATTVFCEDIREEVGGSATIVGILPDNIGVTSMPGAVAKFGIYTRIVLPSDAEAQEMQVVLRKPDGGEDVLGVFTSNLVRDGCRQAQERGNPIVGFVNTAIASPFAVPGPGRFLAIVRTGQGEVITGSVNFEISDQAVQSGKA